MAGSNAWGGTCPCFLAQRVAAATRVPPPAPGRAALGRRRCPLPAQSLLQAVQHHLAHQVHRRLPAGEQSELVGGLPHKHGVAGHDRAPCGGGLPAGEGRARWWAGQGALLPGEPPLRQPTLQLLALRPGEVLARGAGASRWHPRVPAGRAHTQSRGRPCMHAEALASAGGCAAACTRRRTPAGSRPAPQRAPASRPPATGQPGSQAMTKGRRTCSAAVSRAAHSAGRWGARRGAGPTRCSRMSRRAALRCAALRCAAPHGRLLGRRLRACLPPRRLCACLRVHAN